MALAKRFFLTDIYPYKHIHFALANYIFAELDEKWDMGDRAKAYAKAQGLPEPTVLRDLLTFARAFADGIELRGWNYRDLVEREPEPSKEVLLASAENEKYAWKDAAEIRHYVMECLLAGAHLSEMDFGDLGRVLDVGSNGQWLWKKGLEGDETPTRTDWEVRGNEPLDGRTPRLSAGWWLQPKAAVGGMPTS